MRRTALYLTVAALSVTTAFGALAASPGSHHLSRYAAIQARIAVLHQEAVDTHNTALAKALDQMSASLTAYHEGSSRKACPPQSQGGRHGITDPPCGLPKGELPVCPPQAPNSGNTPPCGNGDGQGPGGGDDGDGGGTSTCGPADQGGTAPTGPITNPVYALGKAISDNGGAPLGDAVQSLSCAVNELTGL